ncbi:MAG: PaaI family thioesterase [Methanothrix sp.]|jgi:acyl-CoA thioesterase|nr:PaaI family thioesterase [Methanothrix sp.]MDD3710477.1 PaaI family thioesterase [Methanothrix sp.]MDD5768386.1 PaaI family thioesterase [Methanothrix sp.]MDI9398367.1 PaaI family thioesterase [Euryarchaeota archaeon]
MKVEMTEKETFGAIRRSVEKEPYARSLGIRLEELRLGWAVAEMEFSGDMKDLLGTAHGGALFSLIDEAFGAAANSWGTVAVALNVNVVYVRSPSPGETLRAEAEEVHRSETASTCEIRVLGEDGRLIATAQATGYRKKERLPFRI